MYGYIWLSSQLSQSPSLAGSLLHYQILHRQYSCSMESFILRYYFRRLDLLLYLCIWVELRWNKLYFTTDDHIHVFHLRLYTKQNYIFRTFVYPAYGIVFLLSDSASVISSGFFTDADFTDCKYYPVIRNHGSHLYDFQCQPSEGRKASDAL